MSKPVAALSPVRITGMTVCVTCIPVLITRRHGSGDVAGSVKNAILRLDTDAGITGWGDAAPWAVFTGTIEAAVAALHVYLRPVLIGADPFRTEALIAAADHAVVGHPEAKAAMEMALFDIVGQAAGLPVAELLGGRCRDDIGLSFSVADADFDRDIETVKRLYGEGLRLFKMKTGFAGHAQDLKRMERFREEVPADAELRIDYNQAWPRMTRSASCATSRRPRRPSSSNRCRVTSVPRWARSRGRSIRPCSPTRACSRHRTP